MNDPRWQRVEDLFHEARRRGEAEAELYLKRECAGDERMLAAVKKMLAAAVAADRRFEKGAAVAEALAPILTGQVAKPASPYVGTLLGVWQVDSQLASGGMGDVFLAHRADDQYRRQAAVKLLRKGFDTPELKRRFALERQILAALDHGGIARLLDGGITPDGLPYLVMEYVAGEELDQYCQRHGLGVAARLGLFARVCEAVRYAHSQLVVHRDLKPSNILVTAEGEVKLLDFGIAKFLDATEGEQTSATNVLLTPRYASPEQVLGRPVGMQADVYSLGVVLFELLCGRSPYAKTERTVAEWFEAIQREEPPALRQAAAEERLKREFTADLEVLVSKALRKEPGERYATVERFEADVLAYLAGRPIQARPQTVLYRVGKFARRHAGAVAATALAAVALTGAVGWALWQGQVAERERRLAVQRFEQARELAHLSLFDLFDVIKDVPGATAAQQMLITRSLAHYEKLAREASGDAVLLAEVAAGYARLGDLAGNPYSTNLGDSKRALETYGRGLQLLEPIAEGTGPAEVEKARALLYRSQGEVTGVSGDQKGAAALLQRAVGLLEGQAGKDVEIEIELAATRGSLGDHLGGIGTGEVLDQAGAIASYTKELAGWRSIGARAGLEKSRQLRAKRGVAIATMKLGNATLAVGQYEQALRWYGESEQALDGLEDRDSGPNQRLRTVILKGRALACSALKRPKEALAALTESVGILRGLVRRDAENQQFEYGLAMVLKNRGDVRVESGERAAGVEDYREAEQILSGLSKKDPANAVVRARVEDLKELIRQEAR